MKWDVILESLKAPARQVLLALYAFGLNQLFTFLASKFGFEFTEEQKAQMLSYGTPIVWALLSWIDRILHMIGKQIEEARASTKLASVRSILTTGLTRF